MVERQSFAIEEKRPFIITDRNSLHNFPKLREFTQRRFAGLLSE